MLIDDIMLTWDYIPPTLHSSIQVTKSEQELGIEADWQYPSGSLIPAGDEAIQLATLYIRNKYTIPITGILNSTETYTYR